MEKTMFKKHLSILVVAAGLFLSVSVSALAADTVKPTVAADYVANAFEKQGLINQTFASTLSYDKAIKIQPVFEFAYQAPLAKNQAYVFSQNIEYKPVDYTVAYSPANYSSLSNRLISHAAYIEHHKQANNVNVSFNKISAWQSKRQPYFIE